MSEFASLEYQYHIDPRELPAPPYQISDFFAVLMDTVIECGVPCEHDEYRTPKAHAENDDETKYAILEVDDSELLLAAGFDHDIFKVSFDIKDASSRPDAIYKKTGTVTAWHDSPNVIDSILINELSDGRLVAYREFFTGKLPIKRTLDGGVDIAGVLEGIKQRRESGAEDVRIIDLVRPAKLLSEFIDSLTQRRS